MSKQIDREKLFFYIGQHKERARYLAEKNEDKNFNLGRHSAYIEFLEALKRGDFNVEAN